MFIRSTRLKLILSVLFIFAMGACGGAGGCGACAAMQPLPGGKLPADQTVEGGAQIRVTPQGFNKLTAILPSLVNQQFTTGFCIPEGSVGTPSGGFLATGANYCSGHPSTSCPLGCLVNVALNPNGLTTSVKNQQALNLKLSTKLSTSVHLDGQVVGIGFSCTLAASSNDLTADLDIALDTDPTTGELTVHLSNINSFTLNLDFNGCGPISTVAGLATTILDSFIGQLIAGLLTPTVDNLIQGFLPRPLGLVGMMDVGNLLAGLSPNTKALLEARVTPGGYVHLNANGLSLGVITGINSDRDPTTRTPGLASEPALCVPPLPAPELGAAPTSLPTTSRGTFGLGVASAFNGAPDPGTDVAVGISETTLDLAGHHLVTSGALCLGVGTSFVKQLSVGTISLLVPSLGQLASDRGNDPLLLVTRPQRALDFTIGDNTIASPALTIGVDHLEVDFYAFLYERYVRAFTLDLSMNVGVNLEFEQTAGQPAKIKPTLVGISPSQVKITVLNSEFVKEAPADLEAVLPSVFSLVTPLLGNLPEITVPPFAGFQLDNLAIQHVTTSQDDFLAIYASLGASPLMRQIASRDALMSSAVTAMDAAIPAAPAPSTAQARLAGVVTPTPDRIRGALRHDLDGALPRVTFDVDTRDAAGQPIEWSYQLDDGMWRPWRGGSPLVIEDQAFAWQGKYTIGLKSRVAGDYHTVSEPIQIPVIIDSVPPQIFTDQAAWNGDSYEIPAFDIVSEHALQYAFGKPGSSAPESAWTSGGMPGGKIELSREDAAAYQGEDGKVAVFVKDEAGNTSIALVAPLPAQASGAGCACRTQGAPSAGSFLLIIVVGGLIFRSRGPRGPRRSGRPRWSGRRRQLRRAIVTGTLWAGGSVAMSLQPGCSCGTKPQAQSCESVNDCALPCPLGQLPFCSDNTCTCLDDVPPGRIGPYSDVAVGPDGTIWVSAYAQTHGDLVVAKATGGPIPDEAWEWVDGVPAGPVTIPGAKIRGGIEDDGPDVGMYTSIAVGPDGAPMVSYFDRDTGSLKFAQKVNGTWQTHIVDRGTDSMASGKLGANGALVGMYTSLTLRSDDGRPGIAFLAHVNDAKGARAEVRFVSAQTPYPASAGDWQSWVVDTAPLPPDDPANPGLYPLPEGLGLFIDSARMPNQAPVVAYYDRGSGDLKLAKFNAQAGQFAAAKVLDGSSGVDAGWTPSVAVDAKGVVHVAYVDATANDLKYITDATNATPQVIDDGYRVDGQTVDGLPKPVFDFVGDDASIVMPPTGGPFVAYQDATTQELLLAQQQANGTWTHTSIAGATTPWPGGYGFFAATAVGKNQLVMSTWVVDLPAGNNDGPHVSWVEVFSRPLP